MATAPGSGAGARSSVRCRWARRPGVRAGRCAWRSPGAGRHDKPLTLVKGQEFGTQETRDDWQAPSEPEADAGHPRMLAGIAAGGFDEIGRVAEATRPDVADVGREAGADLVAQAPAEAGIAQALADVGLVERKRAE